IAAGFASGGAGVVAHVGGGADVGHCGRVTGTGGGRGAVGVGLLQATERVGRACLEHVGVAGGASGGAGVSRRAAVGGEAGVVTAHGHAAVVAEVGRRVGGAVGGGLDETTVC